MASHIWLGDLKPMQDEMDVFLWEFVLERSFYITPQAVIAKGNIIEGIEAKT